MPQTVYVLTEEREDFTIIHWVTSDEEVSEKWCERGDAFDADGPFFVDDPDYEGYSDDPEDEPKAADEAEPEPRKVVLE